MMLDPSINFYETQQEFESYWQNKTIEKGKGWKQFKRWENFISPRVYPDGIIRPEILYQEYNKLKRQIINLKCYHQMYGFKLVLIMFH